MFIRRCQGMCTTTVTVHRAPSSAAQPSWAIDSSSSWNDPENTNIYINVYICVVQLVSGVNLKVSTFVCLFVCFDLFHLKMMQFVAIHHLGQLNSI